MAIYCNGCGNEITTPEQFKTTIVMRNIYTGDLGPVYCDYKCYLKRVKAIALALDMDYKDLIIKEVK